ncbi:DUF3311 domain-containing protein [Streptomyces sp. DH8]|uniref:DUF3311 domain-containing protein n=1 Tax=Streptomyces sp. DH8 TaxID=2857008 RepID=UPI0027E17719|nr:DUF3311 domain-containing protein [Streptomyces sp. DH8]
MFGVIRRRPQLLWLLAPYVLYLGALPLVNRVTPLVGGVPFLFAWLLGATLLTPVAVWLTRRADRRERRPHRPDRGPDPRGRADCRRADPRDRADRRRAGPRRSGRRRDDRRKGGRA